jgi:hypothetical protein
VVDRGCCAACELTFAGKAYEVAKAGSVARVIPVVKTFSKENGMNVADHSTLAKKHRALAGFLKSAGESCAEIAAHHERMVGNLAPSAFGEAARQGDNVQAAARGGFAKNWDDTEYDATGGLSRH